MKKVILMIAVAGLIGCASVGKDFTAENVASIQKGVTTEQSLLTMFGKPSSVTVDSDGNKLYGWTYAHATAFSVGQGKALIVKLNKDGLVDSYTLSQTGA